MTPYLSFSGNCEEALTAYAAALGGTVQGLRRYAGSPMEAHVAPAFKDKVMHATLTSPLGTLLASDSEEAEQHGARISLSIEPSAADAPRILEALADGGSIIMPLQEVFWGGRFAMVVDRYGLRWMLSVA